jgi:hypothetical protein
MGLGDATFTYVPNQHSIPGKRGSGKVIFVFRGLMNISGAWNAADTNYQIGP